MVKWVNDDAGCFQLQNELGISVITTEIKVSDIDRQASMENRAREIALDQSRIGPISFAMIKGCPIPMITVRLVGSRFVIAGGNHRFAALPKDTKVIPVHVFESTDVEFETACQCLNKPVGQGATAEQRLAWAADKVERAGMSVSDASLLFEVAPSTLKLKLKTLDVDRRLQAINPRQIGKITKTQIQKLGPLACNDNVLRAACNLLVEGKPSQEEFVDLSRIAKYKKTEAAQVAVFEEALKQRKAFADRVVPRKHRRDFLLGINKLNSLFAMGKNTWKALEIDQSEVAPLKSELKSLIRALSSLSKENG